MLCVHVQSGEELQRLIEQVATTRDQLGTAREALEAQGAAVAQLQALAERTQEELQADVDAAAAASQQRAAALADRVEQLQVREREGEGEGRP